MHKMALLISYGCHTSDDQYMNAAPMIFQKGHDQREKIRWWWEYSTPKKKQRGLLHQLGHSMIIINLAMASIKDHDHHHFNIEVVAQDPAVICLTASLFTLCFHFSQAMVGRHEKQMVEKEAQISCCHGVVDMEHAMNNISLISISMLQMALSQMALYGTRN